MMIKEIPIKEIKFDPTQPRKFIDTEKVEGMAQSMVAQGVINPIEVDETYTIVTGELRYRAASKAGLQTIPCKVIKITKGERFERQVVENVHHNTMSSLDTAEAIKKLLSSSELLRGSAIDKGFSQLAEKIGKSERWIRDTLSILESGKEMLKALKKNEIEKSFAVEIQTAPIEIRPILEKKVLSGEIQSHKIIADLKKTIRDNPEKTKKILAIDFSNKTAEEASSKIDRIATSNDDKAWDANNYFELVQDHSKALLKLLKNPPKVKGEGLIEFNAKIACIELMELKTLLFNIKPNDQLESNA